MNGKSRVLLGIPAFNGIVPQAQESIFNLCYVMGMHADKYDFAAKLIYKKEQFRARNNLVEAALGAGFDWILMLDDDMVVPHDLLLRLLAHDKPVVGALYFQRGGAYHPVLMDRIESVEGVHKGKYASNYDPRIVNPGLHRADIIGGGCMLFKTEVFSKILPPYFWWESTSGTDVSICSRLQDAGVEIYIDTSIELGHVGDPQIVTSRTIPTSLRQMARAHELLFNDLCEYTGQTKHQLESEFNMMSANGPDIAAKWESKPRETWPEIRSFYEEHGLWHVYNLSYWAMAKRDIYKEWAITSSGLPPGATVIDYGPGVGHLAIAMGLFNRFNVRCVDLAGPTSEFLRWRIKQHGLDKGPPTVLLDEFADEVPKWDYASQVDGAFMISMLDHLTRPYDSIEWCARQIKPGGFLVLDYLHYHMEGNPQHLDNYDVHTMDAWMHSIGWETSPEHPWLFYKV